MRENLWSDDHSLPLVLTPGSDTERRTEDLVDWIRAEHNALKQKLNQHGAVLFRGFEVHGAGDFEAVVKSFQSELLNYIEGQSQRQKISGKVYNSTYYPPAETITLHNELSYTRTPPRYLFFSCDVPPGERGETPIVDCRSLLKSFPAELVERFRGRGILYVKNMHGGKGLGKSWQDHFETEDRAVVEQHLRDNDVDFEWREDGSLLTRQVRPAIATHPDTGEEIWFNQATLWHVSELGARGQALLRMVGEERLPTHAYLDGGEAIEDGILDQIRQLSWTEATFFPWQQGDVLFLDNYLVSHGRNSYSGERNILVAMA